MSDQLDLPSHYHYPFLSSIYCTMPSALILLANGTEEMELYAYFWRITLFMWTLINYHWLSQHDHVWHTHSCRCGMYICICSLCRPFIISRPSSPSVCNRISWDQNRSGHTLLATGRNPCKLFYSGVFIPRLSGLQEKFDLLVIPGGAKGAQTMAFSSQIQSLVRSYLDNDKFVGMICAGMYDCIFQRANESHHPHTKIYQVARQLWLLVSQNSHWLRTPA